MYQAVIFDMDGVLVDSQPLHYETDNPVLKKAGYPAVMETVVPYTGVSNPDRWPAYKKALNLEESIEVLIEWQTRMIYEIFESSDIKAIEGIPELLAYISEKGMKIALASSSQHRLIEIVLRKAGIGKFFDVIVSGEDVHKGKPAPDVFLYAAEKLGVAPVDCIVVEDAPSGIKAAKNAGMICIAYRNPNTYGQEFSLADYVADKYEECYKWI
jgi:HAD superfamily hydrolase (TIGR01509 family)